MDEIDQELLGLMTTNEESTSNGKYQQNKRRKRKKDDSESEDEYQQTSSDDEDDDEDESDLYNIESEVDEAELAGMTELEREAFLSERAEKRQQMMEKMAIKQRLKTASSKSTKKARPTTARQKHKSKLEELKAKRRKKLSKGREDGEKGHVEIEGMESDEDEEEDYVNRIKKTFQQDSKQSQRAITKEDLLSVQITRDQLISWMFAPFFESTMVGCFVRLGLGKDKNNQPVYRCCQIVKVNEYHRLYKAQQGPKPIFAKKSLYLKHGKSQKEFLFDVISNSPITEGEFQRWLKTMEGEKQRIPSLNEIQRVQKSVEEAKDHTFTNEEIQYMVEEKRRLVPVTKNAAIEKLHLIAQKEEAKAEGRLEDVVLLEQKLQKVTETEMLQEQFDSEDNKLWQQLNEKNRKRNLEEGRLAEIRLREERQTRRKEGKELDPFARIRTTALNAGDEKLNSPLDSPVENNTLQGTHTKNDVNNEGADAFDQVFASVDIEI